ncbi:MAG: spore cortex biosynthesis protein YabQ [Oscillospiraceae bacterium]|jgi:hypothetical protein|nr:spore cortex biosynthesis protein YabQ [Oscillospiraceae bacterium]MBS6312513.1 spore cortex biosynthesis protein YabQ [Bacillota bacterium]
MEIPVSAQALTFAQGALLGLGLCLAYDLLRALRQLCPRTGLAADALFGLLLTASFLSFALTAGQGQFRLYVFLAVFLTAVLYFLTLSPLMLRVFRGLFRLLGRILRTLFAPVRFFLKFLKKISKTLFASFRKWGTMTCKHILDWKHAQLERSRRRNEIRQVVSAGQAGDSDPRCVRHCYPGAPSLPDQRKGSRGCRADKLHRKHTAGK